MLVLDVGLYTVYRLKFRRKHEIQTRKLPLVLREKHRFGGTFLRFQSFRGGEGRGRGTPLSVKKFVGKSCPWRPRWGGEGGTPLTDSFRD